MQVEPVKGHKYIWACDVAGQEEETTDVEASVGIHKRERPYVYRRRPLTGRYSSSDLLVSVGRKTAQQSKGYVTEDHTLLGCYWWGM